MNWIILGRANIATRVAEVAERAQSIRNTVSSIVPAGHFETEVVPYLGAVGRVERKFRFLNLVKRNFSVYVSLGFLDTTTPDHCNITAYWRKLCLVHRTNYI